MTRSRRMIGRRIPGLELGLRQCFDLGADADGSVLDDSEDGIEGTLRAMIRARRAGDPHGRCRGDAGNGRAFRARRTIDEAMRRGRDFTRKGYLIPLTCSASRAHRERRAALPSRLCRRDRLARRCRDRCDSDSNHGISVKLSALHPRYEMNQKDTMLPVVVERLLLLALAARDARIGLNIDARNPIGSIFRWM